MGLRTTTDGVSVQFVNSDASLQGPPLFGAYAMAYGSDQTDVIDASGVGASADEINYPGSDDWLTFVAVADSQDKLNALLNKNAGPKTAANTSGSSRRVQLELDIAGRQISRRNCVTIGSGPILDIDTPKVDLVHLKILPDGVKLGDLGNSNRLVQEFQGTSVTLVATSLEQSDPRE